MDGIFCLDKPADMTSFQCCAALRRLLGEKKIGHGGTLDPMATGVLPILVGRATRALDLLPVHDKRYTATLRFGYTSDTLDVWGTVTPTGRPLPSLSAIEAALPAFRGGIRQIPPMMSALKKDGVRLYDLARQGVEIEREARPVTIYSLDILGYDPAAGELRLDCHCSRGTYIRSLCDDLGRRLDGAGAIMTALRRTMAAGYTLEDCLPLEEARRLAAAPPSARPHRLRVLLVPLPGRHRRPGCPLRQRRRPGSGTSEAAGDQPRPGVRPRRRVPGPGEAGRRRAENLEALLNIPPRARTLS